MAHRETNAIAIACTAMSIASRNSDGGGGGGGGGIAHALAFHSPPAALQAFLVVGVASALGRPPRFACYFSASTWTHPVASDRALLVMALTTKPGTQLGKAASTE